MLTFPKWIFGSNSKHVCGSRWPLEELQLHVFNFTGFCSVLTPHIIKTSCLRAYNQLLAHKLGALWCSEHLLWVKPDPRARSCYRKAEACEGLMQWTPVSDRKQMKRNLILLYADRMCAGMDGRVFISRRCSCLWSRIRQLPLWGAPQRSGRLLHCWCKIQRGFTGQQRGKPK